MRRPALQCVSLQVQGRRDRLNGSSGRTPELRVEEFDRAGRYLNHGDGGAIIAADRNSSGSAGCGVENRGAFAQPESRQRLENRKHLAFASDLVKLCLQREHGGAPEGGAFASTAPSL